LDFSPSTPTTPPTLRISFKDILEKRAFIRLPGEAKIKLLHKGGAPWADRNPDARLSEFQKNAIRRNERHCIVHGGSRLGKSVLGGSLGICELMLPGTFTAFIAARYEHVNDEWKHFASGLKRLFGDHQFAFTRWVHKYQQNYYAFEVETAWGSRAVGYAVDVDEGEVLLGKEFSRIIVGEGSRVSAEISENRIKRALDGRLMNNLLREESGYLTIFTTPDGYDGLSSYEWDRVERKTKGDLAKVHYGKVPFAETYWLCEASVLENPAYDRKVFDARQREAEASGDTAAFDEAYRGLRTYATGRVFREFKDSLHRVEPPSSQQLQSMRFGVGIDTGACFGAVLAGLDREGVLWWLGEVYTEKRHVRESCMRVREMVLSVLGPAFDTADWEVCLQAVELWTIDPASQHKTEVSEYLGDAPLEHPARGFGKFDLIPSIDQLRQVMHDDKFRLVLDCTNTFDQLRKWVWKRTKTGEKNKLIVVREPIKGNDHCLDAGRFISIPLMELGPRLEAPEIATFRDSYQSQMRDATWSSYHKILKDAEEAGGIAV
jgi:hypothetical protein